VSRRLFSPSEMRLLSILAAVQFTHIVDFMIVMPLGPQLMRIMQIDPDQFSLLVSAYTFCAGATGLLSAFFLDYFDRKRSLIFFYTGFGLGTLACAMAESYHALLAARAFTGAFGGILGSLVFAIVGDVIAAEKRGTAMGIVMGAFSLASIFGVPFSLYLAGLGNWHTPLYLLAILAIPVIAMIMLSVPPIRGHLAGGPVANPWHFLKTVPFQRRPGLAIILMASIVLGQFSIIPFLSPSLVANVGLREDQLPYVYLVGGIFSIISSPLIGRWSDKIGPIKVMMIAAPVSAVVFLTVTLLPPVPLFVALGICAILFMSMGGRMVPTLALVTGSVAPRNRGAFMSLTNSVQQFSAASAAFIAGHIIKKDEAGHLLHYGWVGLFAVVLTGIAMIIGWSLRKDPNQVQS
jgi:DHA1 family inner membrane transport protein